MLKDKDATYFDFKDGVNREEIKKILEQSEAYKKTDERLNKLLLEWFSQYTKGIKSLRTSKPVHELKEAGFEDILVIPGNHDYGTGSRGNKKYVHLFKQSFFNENRDYPLVDIIDRVAFIGLDSMAEELHWYDRLWAQGELGKKQLNRLSSIFTSDDVVTCKKRVIYLHHHPFDQRPLHQLKDTNKRHDVLMNAVNGGISIDAILYGHNH